MNHRVHLLITYGLKHMQHYVLVI